MNEIVMMMYAKLFEQDRKEVAALHTKVVAIMEEVGQIGKDGEVFNNNGKLMYRYLSEEATTSALQSAYVKNRVTFHPLHVTEEFFYLENQDRYTLEKVHKSPMTKVNVVYKIVDADTGAFDLISSVGYGTDNGDKGTNKALTNAMKYAQRQTFAISTDAHDDADSYTLEGGFQPPQKFNGPPPVEPGSPPSNAGKIKDQMKDQRKKNDELLTKTKKLWQELAGSLDGFQQFYDAKIAEGVKPERILEILEKRQADAERKAAAAAAVGK